MLAFVLKTVAKRKPVTRAETDRFVKQGWREADVFDAVVTARTT